jgi:hypothetical protein
MCGRLWAVVAAMTGARGGACWRRSAEPDREVEELLPCLAIMRRAEAMIEAVVETLYVLWP